MSPRARVRWIVLACVLAGAGIAVGAAALQSEHTDTATSLAKPRAGYPPLALDLGLRTDALAADLRRGNVLYDAGSYAAAAAVFARYPDDEQARIGLAFARWPDGGLRAIERLGQEDPGSSLVLLHVGLGRSWAGLDASAVDAWRAAKRVQPDTVSAVTADGELHPDYAPGLPLFTPSFDLPVDVSALPPQRQVAVLERRARTGGYRDRIAYGMLLQRLGRPISARRLFLAAAAEAPDDVDAQVAAAVGLFDKDRPAAAFARLGPLAQRFPHAPTVRFHLGLLLIWIRQIEQAKKELSLAVAAGPRTPIGKDAARLLASVLAAQGK